MAIDPQLMDRAEAVIPKADRVIADIEEPVDVAPTATVERAARRRRRKHAQSARVAYTPLAIIAACVIACVVVVLIADNSTVQIIFGVVGAALLLLIGVIAALAYMRSAKVKVDDVVAVMKEMKEIIEALLGAVRPPTPAPGQPGGTTTAPSTPQPGQTS